jgi:hypothetical protein
MARPVQSVTRSIHRRSYWDLPIGKKWAFYDKFRPYQEQEANLYLMYPGRSMPRVKKMKALMHMVNIDILKLITEVI